MPQDTTPTESTPEAHPGVVLRAPHGPQEYPALREIWRRSVAATHDFLAEEHRQRIESALVSDYFPQVHLTVAELDGAPVAFSGTHGGNLEMLFVDDAARGRGLGRTLLRHVIREDGVRTVDVNEQNAQAVGFYQHEGFEVTGRSPVDQDGLPYPLLHLRLA